MRVPQAISQLFAILHSRILEVIYTDKTLVYKYRTDYIYIYIYIYINRFINTNRLFNY